MHTDLHNIPIFFFSVDRPTLVVPSSKHTSCHCPLHFIYWYLLQFLMPYKNCSKKSANSCQILGQARLRNIGNPRHSDPALSSDTTTQRGNLMVLTDFCTSAKMIKRQPTVSLVPDPMKMSRTPNTSYMAVCSSLLNTAPCPFIQTPKCIYQLTRWWKSLAEALSTCKSRLPSTQQVFTPISKLPPCPLTAQIIHLHWKQKANESKETLIHLIGWIWELPFLQANLPTDNRPSG